MDFIEATDELRAFVLIDDIAEALGVTPMDVRYMRRSAGSKKTVAPPDGWQPSVAALARKQASRLLELADQLDQRQEQSIQVSHKS